MEEHRKNEDAKTQEFKEYFWGGIDPHRINLFVVRDLLLDPPQSGKPLKTFGYPFARVGDRTIDRLDPANFKYKFTYKEN